MKKILLLLTLMIFGVTLQAQNTKIGSTSAYAVLPHLPEYVKAQDSLQGVEKILTNQLLEKQNEFKTKLEKFEKDRTDPNIPPVSLQTRARDLQRMEQEIAQEQELYMRELQKLQVSLQNPILKKVKTAIEEVGKENGYTFILNSQDGNGFDNFLYATDAIDVTLLVLKKLGVTMTQEELEAANEKIKAEQEAEMKKLEEEAAARGQN